MQEGIIIFLRLRHNLSFHVSLQIPEIHSASVALIDVSKLLPNHGNINTSKTAETGSKSTLSWMTQPVKSATTSLWSAPDRAARSLLLARRKPFPESAHFGWEAHQDWAPYQDQLWERLTRILVLTINLTVSTLRRKQPSPNHNKPQLTSPHTPHPPHQLPTPHP
jgi:hypothetical protein